MPRDYKHVPKHKDKPKGSRLNALLTFVAGLSLGLFVALFIYFNQTDGQYSPFNIKLLPGTAERPPVTDQNNTPGFTDEEKQELPTPSFDFYNILPNKEINISEWVAEDQSLPVSNPSDDNSVYILQVGSFRQIEAADQVKAQLALLGIQANIQRVVINGQDTRYRVRVGPYTDQTTLNEERRRLMENNLEFMLLKLQADDPRLNEG